MMLTSVTCDDCGKKYAVPETTLGKRVKCKQCGHVFVAAAQAVAVPVRAAVSARVATATPRAQATRPATKKVTPPPPPLPAEEEDEYRFKNEPRVDDWSQLESAAAATTPAQDEFAGNVPPTSGAATALRYTSAGWDFTRGFISRNSFHTVVLLGSVVLAVLMAVLSLVIPSVAIGAIFIFPVLAIAYFLIGMIVVASQSLKSAGQLRLPVGDILFVCIQILIGFVIPLPVIVYRRQMFGSGLGKFYKGLLGVVFRSIVIFILAGLTPLLAGAMGVHIGSIANRPNQYPSTYTPTYAPPYHPNPTSYAPPQESFSPSSSHQMDPASSASKTGSNLIILAGQIGMYRQRHNQQVPAALDDLDNQSFVATMRVSPFDPAQGTSGYVYLPDNLQAGNGRVMLYDAAELEKTGSTHVLVIGQAPPVKTMTREELSAQPGVQLQ